MANPKPLEGKIAIVTGASRGIGRAIALRLAQDGATLVLASRTAVDLEKVASEIKSKGGRRACRETFVILMFQPLWWMPRSRLTGASTLS